MIASIIIALDSSYAFTELFLFNLSKYETIKNYELIFTDDGNTSVDYKQLIAKYFESFIFVPHKTKLGYGKVNNEAILFSTTETLIFMNSDIILTNSCLEILLKNMHLYSAAAVQPLLIYPQTGKVQSAGHIFSKYYNAHLFENRRIEDEIVNIPSQRKALTTALCVIKKSEFIEIGGFDEYYFNAWEGMELHLKLSLDNKICYYIPQAIAFHIRGGGRNQYYIDERPQTARFWSMWGNKIEEDISDIIAMQLKDDDRNREYIVLNFSCITDPKYIFDKLCIRVEQYVNYCELSGSKTIDLLKTLPYIYLYLDKNIIFFCNNYDCLIKNVFWFTIRKDKNDLFIDLSANVIHIMDYHNLVSKNIVFESLPEE